MAKLMTMPTKPTKRSYANDPRRNVLLGIAATPLASGLPEQAKAGAPLCLKNLLEATRADLSGLKPGRWRIVADLDMGIVMLIAGDDPRPDTFTIPEVTT